jgi:hypothetical protein
LAGWREGANKIKGDNMGILLIIGIIILVLWLLGFLFFKSIGAIIHIALVIGLILIIIWLLKAVFKLF